MNRDVCDRCGKVTRDGDVHTCSPKGLPHCENSCEANAFKIEIRRLKAEKKELLEALKEENERLTKLCYDYIGELTAMRAAKQMQDRIDKMKARNNT